MGKLIIVKNDKVEGTDKHNVKGTATNPAPPPPIVPYIGVGDFDYNGEMTELLSDFVTINGQPVATKKSKSFLALGEDVPPSGKHSGPQGKNFNPPSPKPIPITLMITDPIGEGNPSATSGSSFVTINSIAILLNNDKIDTCDGLGIPMNSTVTSKNQDFVFCSL